MTSSNHKISCASEMHIAILGPCHTKPFIPYLKTDISSLPKGMGGYNISHLILARLDNNIRTDMITCDPGISTIRYFEGDFLRLWVVPRRTKGLLRDFYKIERNFLLKAIKESNAECLHANWTTEYALAAFHSKMPWILSLHDNPAAFFKWIGVRHIIPLYISISLVKKAPIITGVSPYVCRFIESFSGKHAKCVPNPIHLPLLNMTDNTKKNNSECVEKTIVSILNWSKFKNVKNGLLAFKMLVNTKHNVKLILIGPGLGSGSSAEKWARENGLSHNVIFTGVVPYSECVKYISNADILFHPALEEAMGCQVAEAMSLGIPVVCAIQAKGPMWLINNGQYGIATDGKKPESMALHLAETLNQIREIKKTVCPLAKQHINKITNAESILKQYTILYKESIKAFS